MRHRTPIAICVLLLAAVPAYAQQGSRFNDRLMFDPNSFSGARQSDAPQTAPAATTTTGQSAPPAARQAVTPPQQQPQQASKPKPAARTAATPQPRRTAPVERRIGDTTATASTRSATDRPVPREEPNLGRLSIPQGSLGYESRTQMQTYDMSDGRRVPGYDNIQRNDSSYFGLSLRMPTAPTSSPFALGSHGAN